MAIYIAMYKPVLMTFGIVIAGCVLSRLAQGGGIDPGPPNARSPH